MDKHTKYLVSTIVRGWQRHACGARSPESPTRLTLLSLCAPPTDVAAPLSAQGGVCVAAVLGL